MTPFVAIVLAGAAALFCSGIWCAYVAPIRQRRRARALDRWAADWELRHHHVQIIELPKRGSAQ